MNENPKLVTDYVGRIGTFITAKGFFYRGRLEHVIGKPPTHYRIYDFKTGMEMDLLIMTIETIKWEGS